MDTQFQDSLHEAMLGWRRVHSFGMDWWEVIEIAKERKGELSLLLVKKSQAWSSAEAGRPEISSSSDPTMVPKSL